MSTSTFQFKVGRLRGAWRKTQRLLEAYSVVGITWRDEGSWTVAHVTVRGPSDWVDRLWEEVNAA